MESCHLVLYCVLQMRLVSDLSDYDGSGHLGHPQYLYDLLEVSQASFSVGSVDNDINKVNEITLLQEPC